MKKAVQLLVVCAIMLFPAILAGGERFDGNWRTTLTCPPKGKTDGYTWKFVSKVTAGNLRGGRGIAGEPGYFLIEGKIKEDGSAKIAASGIVASRQYARGVFASKGEEYNYDVKVQFTDTAGSGTRSEGLGIVGRPCTFDFVKLPAETTQTGSH
jgi:hypothetical protein